MPPFSAASIQRPRHEMYLPHNTMELLGSMCSLDARGFFVLWGSTMGMRKKRWVYGGVVEEGFLFFSFLLLEVRLDVYVLRRFWYRINIYRVGSHLGRCNRRIFRPPFLCIQRQTALRSKTSSMNNGILFVGSTGVLYSSRIMGLRFIGDFRCW